MIISWGKVQKYKLGVEYIYILVTRVLQFVEWAAELSIYEKWREVTHFTKTKYDRECLGCMIYYAFLLQEKLLNCNMYLFPFTVHFFMRRMSMYLNGQRKPYGARLCWQRNGINFYCFHVKSHSPGPGEAIARKKWRKNIKLQKCRTNK